MDEAVSMGDARTGDAGAPGGSAAEDMRGHGASSLGERVTTPRGRQAAGRLRVGDRILGRYRVTGELGQGGMGVVYRCFDEVGGIDVALKALPPELSHDTGEMEEVRENFRLVAGLVHQNIASAKTLEKDPATGDVSLIMECVEGMNLRQWRKAETRSQESGARSQKGGVAPEKALPVLRQAAAALDFAHEQKVVHRDVKPANIMLRADGIVKVLDFGLAAQIHTSLSRVSRVHYGTSGTGPYMAPEQWEGRRQDERTDQYALAATAYELLAGRCPFENHDTSILREAVLRQKPEPLAGLTKAQNAALLRGLAKEPGERFATCGEFVAALGGRGRVAVGSGSRQWKKAALWLAAAAVAGYGAYRAYGTYSARRSAERAAAEQAAALDAAQRGRLEGLRAAAEAALAAGDLEAAGARIAELGREGGSAAELRKRYEAKAGERETNRRYAAASVARDAARRLERGQGFGARLDALEVTWREAEAARQGGGWGQALSGYDAVLAGCKALEAEEASREDAKTRRGEAEKAKAEAEQAGAAKDAEELFGEGGRTSARAAELFEKGAFVEAGKAWEGAARGYASAKARAGAVQAYARAKSAFEEGLGGRDALLARHGREKWSEVRRLQTLGAASANDPAAGEKAYRDALAALPGAVAEAQAAEKAEAERLAAEKKAREEKERREKAEAAYAAWRTEAEGVRSRLEREGPSAKGSSAKGLIESAEAALAGAGLLDAANLAPASAEGVKTLAAALRTLKGRVRAEPEPGDVQTVDLGGGVRLELVWCPPGSYTRGSPASEAGRDDDETQHRVTLTKGFWMGKTEVTQAQWEAVTGSTPSRFMNAGKNAPVESVSWNDCQEFVRKLNARVPGGGFRLPTEAEWEYACRAGTTTALYSGPLTIRGAYNGPELDDIAWYGGNSGVTYAGGYDSGGWKDKQYDHKTAGTHPVGQKKSNAWGLHDMIGNVWEWCQDWHGDYPTGSVTDPTGPDSGLYRVGRGGCWYYFARYCRSASRNRNDPGYRGISVGLRLARTLNDP